MRTTRGSPYYSISNQGADKWADPKPLKYNDDSEPLKHPLSPCPIFQYEKDKYFILFHNHDGHYKDFGPLDTQKHRRPIYLAKGVYSKKAKQPITFSEPEFLMDHTGKGLGISDRHDLAMYCSFTQMNGNNILWYPDRKFFLLGKILPL